MNNIMALIWNFILSCQVNLGKGSYTPDRPIKPGDVEIILQKKVKK